METLYLVVPCYNEEEVLPETSTQLLCKLTSLVERGIVSDESRILLVDDGSKDKTWEMITDLHEGNSYFAGIKLARNMGHQNALLAGLMTAKEVADITISLDADLQDDIDAIDHFIEKYNDGCDVVYGVRSARKTDTFFKRNTAHGFYSIMRSMGVEIIDDHADYRLMSKRAVEGLAEFREVNLFLRGIVPLIGYTSGVVEYERKERFAGESKYPLRKMLNFALDGITSFSIKPIRLVTTIGLMIFLASLAMLVYFLVLKLLDKTVPGWTTLVMSIWMIGGIQLLSLGVIGEYIGKIYKEVKDRPKYIIQQYINK
ncbi:MAG TPA: glycosyltransferase family 2 protein [Oscillospiraceae bacterium]|nr:glycosyltransferase family 2 protein [Oscillospiraceae bacterium]